MYVYSQYRDCFACLKIKTQIKINKTQKLTKIVYAFLSWGLGEIKKIFSGSLRTRRKKSFFQLEHLCVKKGSTLPNISPQ